MKNFSRLIGLAALMLVVTFPARAEEKSAPPRSIDDLLKLIDRHRPDPSFGERARAAAEASPPSTQDPAQLAEFYLRRGIAAGQVGAAARQLADLKRAVELGSGADWVNMRLARDSLQRAEILGGNVLSALRMREEDARTAKSAGARFSAFGNLIQLHLRLGDRKAARESLESARGAFAAIRSPSQFETAMSFYRTSLLARDEGNLVEAEESLRKSIDLLKRDAMRRASSGNAQGDTLRNDNRGAILEAQQRALASVLAQQGSFAEAEMVLREAFLAGQFRSGQESVFSASTLESLANVFIQQGRPRDGERLLREVVGIFERVGAAPEADFLVRAQQGLGRVRAMSGQWEEANAAFERADEGRRRDPELLRRQGSGDLAWALARIRVGQEDRAIAMLQGMRTRSTSRFGADSFPVAEIRGFLGIAQLASGRREEALREFAAAVPVLLERGDEQSGASGGASRVWRQTQILEAYVAALIEEVRAGRRVEGVDAVSESFRLADVARGGRVQRALSASAARAAITDPELAELARKEQDTEHRTAALDELLRNVLSAPADQQVPGVIEDLRKSLVELRAEHRRLKGEISRRFPDYANLVDPKPPTVEQVRASLREGEALISTYTSATQTFVWAIPKAGAPAVGAAPVGAGMLASRVASLRRALDSEATSIREIPRFDVASAHALFNELLKPVEAGWGQATSLLVVPHQALGQLPLGLLPTSATTLPAEESAPFEGYRTVPWLARRAAITQLPSANALITLRRMPAGDPSRRAFVGFGDPYFSKSQAAEGARQQAEVAMATRGAKLARRNAPKLEGVSSAELAHLPRLVDTRDEVLEVARVVKADPGTDVFLGELASVKTVKGMPLANRKVIHFATHGLVPGDLDGLTQPALALTSPEVAGAGNGDGLLKMEDVLGLKLNADWVVLSACNTAAGDGSGEAVSGLGRAFFFAGARALLVSNWPVDSVAARKLMTDLFRRQASDAKLTRAEALRQTLVDMIDNGAEVDPATRKPTYWYAHPLYWAPFSLVGDGGGS